jgi:hypothetical protein
MTRAVMVVDMTCRDVYLFGQTLRSALANQSAIAADTISQQAR